MTAFKIVTLLFLKKWNYVTDTIDALPDCFTEIMYQMSGKTGGRLFCRRIFTLLIYSKEKVHNQISTFTEENQKL